MSIKFMINSKINKTVLNSSGVFSDDKLGVINGAYDTAVMSARKLLLDLPNVDIVFYNNSRLVISEIGIGGNTETENVIIIPLDAKFDFTEKELMLTICHELHHTARMSKLGSTDSLIKKIVSEGLADQFELEIDPGHRPITYRMGIGVFEIVNGLKDLKQIIQSEDGEYDYYEWFFGYGKYPNWFGYTVGNYIIENYCKDNNTLPSQLVDVPADNFVTYLDILVKKQADQVA